MHSQPTHLVPIKTRRLIRTYSRAVAASTLFGALLSLSSGLYAQNYVDLTGDFPQGTESPKGVPGAQFDGSSHSLPVPLPLEVTVQDLFPTAAEAGGRFTALILVRNTGKEPHSIAVSRDFAVLKAGNQGKQEL